MSKKTFNYKYDKEMKIEQRVDLKKQFQVQSISYKCDNLFGITD